MRVRRHSHHRDRSMSAPQLEGRLLPRSRRLKGPGPLFYGSDDGVEFFNLASVEKLAANPSKPNAKPQYLIAEVTPQSITLSVSWRLQKRKA